MAARILLKPRTRTRTVLVVDNVRAKEVEDCLAQMDEP
jgi:hypothetical protein